METIFGKKKEENPEQTERVERTKAVIDSNAINSAMDAVPRGSNQEPILAQLDEWSRAQTIALIYEVDERESENGEIIRVITKIKYPELHELAGYALSHLNLMVNLTWEDSRALLLNFWSGDYKRLKEVYADNEEALNILRAIQQIYERNVMAAVDGSQQLYASMWSGGKRQVEVQHHMNDTPQ